MTETRGRILIIRGGTVGEFVMSCPVFRALREQFPGAALEVLGYPRVARLALAAGLVDAVRSIESRAAAGFFARNAPLDLDLAGYFARFSVIFSYLYDPDGYFQGNVAKVSPAQFISGRPRPDEGKAIHACETFLQPLERLAIFGADTTPRLNLSQQTTLPPGSWLAIHPGVQTNPRHWPEVKWRNLIQALLEKTGYNLLLAGGDAERQLLNALSAAANSNRILVRHNAPLPELGAEIAACHAFVGHDSGISHLAAALAVPSVVIWGAKNAALWRPRGVNVTVLNHRAGAIAITVEEVLAALPMAWTGTE